MPGSPAPMLGLPANSLAPQTNQKPALMEPGDGPMPASRHPTPPPFAPPLAPSTPAAPPTSDESFSDKDGGADSGALLPKHTRVRVAGNARTRAALVGMEGRVRRAVGLGGWHWLASWKRGRGVGGVRASSWPPRRAWGWGVGLTAA